MTFDIRWLRIPAGTAVLEVLPPVKRDGQDSLHFRLTARTNAFLDTIYPVRDRVDSWTDPAMTRTLHYRKRQHEGNTHRDVTVAFDWQARTAQYITPGESRHPIDILPGTFDPFSVLYFARSQIRDRPDLIERPVTDGKKLIMGRGTLVRREMVRLRSGAIYDTYLLEPEIEHIGGVFKKSPRAKLRIWITADDRCLLVKVQSKVVVGSFTAELIAAERNSAAFPANERWKSATR